ncbi:putative PH domain-containing protein PB16A4.02c [Golovinomyces cichoracearum]|uniref:Putative PH domain-containing protein PB16A4.02c n=1 Tax=Golovinomyces cichoracearum TaxID=62708 RepID=A0A420ITA3_9PEZI|nr:putative PH domain-containing protein PB16A4.02c [Golovinomyces cichoracearum]
MTSLMAPVQQNATVLNRKISTSENLNESHLKCGAQSNSIALGRARNSILKLDLVSPVNQNGSFEFDRVLKCGVVQKRTRKTKAWKSIFLVLRPNSLSIYKNQSEEKLRHKIHLSDLTAVTFLKDPKNKRHHIFGLFSPSRNYHLEAQSTVDAKEWVDLIRRESRVEEEEEELVLASPIGKQSGSLGLEKAIRRQSEQRRLHDERLGSSSPEPGDPIIRPRKYETINNTGLRRPSHTIDYSGNEVASYSDRSDGEFSRIQRKPKYVTMDDESISVKPSSPQNISSRGNQGQLSYLHADQDSERVVWQGFLLWLRSKGGVRQWKDMWVVIRCKSITCYKDDSEYSPSLIIPLLSIISAVEIDPVSRTKKLCLQIITEEKSYRFCAHSEDALDKSLGAIKSLIAKRRDTRIA